MCLFSHQFGQENEDVEQMQKRTTNLKYFSATHGEVTISALTWSSNIQWNGRNIKAYHLKIIFFVKNDSAEVINMRSFIQLEGIMKAHIIAKQKFKFIIDAEIIVTLILDCFSAI